MEEPWTHRVNIFQHGHTLMIGNLNNQTFSHVQWEIPTNTADFLSYYSGWIRTLGNHCKSFVGQPGVSTILMKDDRDSTTRQRAHHPLPAQSL